MLLITFDQVLLPPLSVYTHDYCSSSHGAWCPVHAQQNHGWVNEWGNECPLSHLHYFNSKGTGRFISSFSIPSLGAPQTFPKDCFAKCVLSNPEDLGTCSFVFQTESNFVYIPQDMWAKAEIMNLYAVNSEDFLTGNGLEPKHAHAHTHKLPLLFIKGKVSIEARFMSCLRHQLSFCSL